MRSFAEYRFSSSSSLARGFWRTHTFRHDLAVLQPPSVKSRVVIDVPAQRGPFQGATGQATSLHDSVFTTIPGSPAYVGKASSYKVNMLWSLIGLLASVIPVYYVTRAFQPMMADKIREASPGHRTQGKTRNLALLTIRCSPRTRCW